MFRNLPEEYSHLYLGIEGKLAAVICIEDPLRPEAPEVIKQLRKAGFTQIVMMTGDSDRTAKQLRRESVSINIIPKFSRKTKLNL